MYSKTKTIILNIRERDEKYKISQTSTISKLIHHQKIYYRQNKIVNLRRKPIRSTNSNKSQKTKYRTKNIFKTNIQDSFQKAENNLANPTRKRDPIPRSNSRISRFDSTSGAFHTRTRRIGIFIFFFPPSRQTPLTHIFGGFISSGPAAEECVRRRRLPQNKWIFYFHGYREWLTLFRVFLHYIW